jgi:hypothetical protein
MMLKIIHQVGSKEQKKASNVLRVTLAAKTDSRPLRQLLGKREMI